VSSSPLATWQQWLVFTLGAPVVLAVGVLVTALAACASPLPSPSAQLMVPSLEPESTSPSGPLTREDVEARLRSLDPGLSLVVTRDDRDVGVFPESVYCGATSAASGVGTAIGVVLIYRSPSDRASMQPRFRPMSIEGLSGTISWDGVVHSEWIGVQNVLVEVVIPGGTFGGKATAEEQRYPELVRSALAR
jgi:hypothetical protein